MKSIIRPLGISMLLGCATTAWAQESAGPKIDRVDIKFVGPASVSEDFVRSNIRLKAGVAYTSGMTQDGVHSLYSTGQFYNIRVSVDQADDGGVILTYTVQSRPRISEIKLEGNNKLTDNKLRKLITVKAGDPLDEQKLFSDVLAIKKQYEKYGLADTTVKYVLSIDEATGSGTVTFQVHETPKVKIENVEFVGATAFTQKELRGVVKTHRHWMFSWITSNGFFQQDRFDDDRGFLEDFYHNHGYLDFQVQDVQRVYPTPHEMVIRYTVYEGRQYKVGSVKISGGTIFPEKEIVAGLQYIHDYQHLKGHLGPNGLPMDVSDTFTPDGLSKDVQAIEDFYGSRGYIDISQGAVRVLRVPNIELGTMDLEFQLPPASQKDRVQKVEIHGNLKTKDKVIRRELAISPGEVFDMVRVKLSQQRLEGMNYFSKVEMDPEPTDPAIPGEKNLIVNVEEQNTGNFTVGAGINSDSGLIGYATISQSNFDPFHPPYFTGGGQKIELRVQLGTREQDYELSYVQPWFLDRKLSLGIDLYRHQLDYESPNDIYDETRTGASVSLTRALFGNDFFIGSTHYTIEQVGISLNDGWHGLEYNSPSGIRSPQNVPSDILLPNVIGVHLYQRVGGSLAYDTRNSVQLPNHGQRTELSGEVSDEITSGNSEYYKLELTTAWYFPGFFKGNVLEIGGRTGVADAFSGGDVPFYDRYYLGGLYSMRGYKFRNVAPRDPNYAPGHSIANEPIGGDSYWFGSAEYSFPIFEKDGGVSLRFALFYDIGSVASDSYTISGEYDDNWGVGIRLNIPHLGPLRLDYGIPITHDKYNGSSGQFQFGFGYTRQF